MNNFLKNKIINKNPARLILLIYLIIILIGTFILMSPLSSRSNIWSNPLDALFTTVSAVCVTGLSTVSTAIHWNFFGKIVIIILIQLGGLGVMTAASIVSLIFNKRFSISDRMFLSQERNTITTSGIIELIKFIIISTFIIELIGAVFFMFTFIPEYGLSKGIWYSIFHSISAFCNAGFDIIGQDSLSPYATNFNISFVVSILIILGGIGHKVISEILEYKFNFKKYSLHAKLVFMMSLILLVIPTILFLILEWNNPDTIGQFSFFNKLLTSFFQATTLRTAGFYTTNQALYLTSSTLIMLILMFIGGSPAGTAGGFKTTSFLSLFLISKANIKQERNITIFRRNISNDILNKILALFTISLSWIFIVTLLISISDPDKELINILYEVFSAYGTVGLTRGITANLSSFAKVLIIFTMIFGKLGPLSLFAAVAQKSKPKSFKYREEDIIIG